MSRGVIFGASRGLGREFLKLAQDSSEFNELLVISRKSPLSLTEKSRFLSVDLSDPTQQLECLTSLGVYSPSRVFYFVGGGPYGLFQEKKWNAHQWALEVSFIFPARLIHFIKSNCPEVGQLVLVGSAIAENKADPMAASYSAAKHALRGLVYSIRAESPLFDLRLYSPGYMDTDMLPKGSRARSEGLSILRPQEVALDLWNWAKEPNAEFHRVIES